MRPQPAAERLLGAALNAAANAIVITDRDGIIQWANPAFVTLTGYPVAEAVGKNPRDLVKSGRQERAMYAEMWATILAGRVWRGELVNRRKDGTFYPEEMTITPVLGRQGAITNFIAIKQDLTGRKQAAETLRQSERHFRALTDNSLDIVTVVDATGIIQYESHSLERVLGWKPVELVGRNIFELVHPDDLAQVRTLLELKLPLPGVIESAEFRYRHRDGTWRTIDAIGTSLMQDPAVGGIVINSRDITMRIQAESALREEQTLLSNLMATIPDHVYFKDRQSRFVRINAAQARSFRLRGPEAAVGRTDFDIFGDEHAQRAFAEEQRMMETGEPLIGIEEKEDWPDGRVTWVSSTKVPLRDAAGRITGLMGISRDITLNKETEKKLREQNEILSNSHDAVMIVDLENKITLWNRAAEEVFGWPAAEVTGRPPEEVLGIDELGVVPTLRQAVASAGFWNGEVRAQTRDGRKLTLDFRITLVRDEAGRPRARLSLIADITEKKLLEEKFLHSQRLESIGMLAAGIAHDLNNVLAPIVFAAPMLRGSLSAPRDLAILDTLERSAGRGAGLVKQILGFARSTTGEFRATQVKHLARDVIELMEETFPKSIRLEHEVPSDLWPVMGDPTQIHQVLMNLCVNARDAMPQGGTLSVKLANRRLDEEQVRVMPEATPGPWLVIEVADTGSGIAPEVLAHVWEPFFTTKSAGRGTGLGLSTVRGLVASHHGFVTLDTVPGQGTTFRVFLPATESDETRVKNAMPFDQPAGNGELVLVVDDDAAIRTLVSAIMVKSGYRAVSCVDGVEAIIFFSKHAAEISLIITDVDMPKLGGADLAVAVAQARPEVRILAMSGLSRHESGGVDLPEIKRVAHAFLLKPFTAEILAATVHELLHPKTPAATP